MCLYRAAQLNVEQSIEVLHSVVRNNNIESIIYMVDCSYTKCPTLGGSNVRGGERHNFYRGA